MQNAAEAKLSTAMTTKEKVWKWFLKLELQQLKRFLAL